ncbi:hypothetical protein Peur_031390 [Populus x canadensis]
MKESSAGWQQQHILPIQSSTFPPENIILLKERKLYRGSMRKMGSSSAEDIPAMQEIVLEFRASKMFFYGKKVNQALGRVYILKFNTDDRKFFIWMQIRTGNLVVLDLGAEVMSDITSSSGPVKLEDLQRILSNIGGGGMFCSDSAIDHILVCCLGLGDILKPDLIMPLNETLPLEEGLTSHLPEGYWTPEDILDLLQSPPFRQQVNSFT